MKSFRDPITGVLKAWGYAESNGSDIARDEPEGFNLAPGKWKFSDGKWVATSPNINDLIARNVAAIQAELDRRAQAKGYDSILSACSYAAPEGVPFQTEGAAFLKWRSDVWAQAYAVLAEVQAGTKPLPTPEQAVASMPPLVLP